MFTSHLCISTSVVAQIGLQPLRPKRKAHVYEMFALFLISLLKTLWGVQDAPVHRDRDHDYDGHDGVPNQGRPSNYMP